MKLKKLVKDIYEDNSSLPLVDIKKICTHSSEVSKNSVFVAVKGFTKDGHDYIDEAIRKGASAIISDSKNLDFFPVPNIKVKDSKLALSRIASKYYNHPSKDLNIVGITGTNGKTTTASILNSIFKANGYNTAQLGTIGTITDLYQTTKTLTTLDPINLHRKFRDFINERITHIVMEVSSHALEQSRVADVDFDICAFTNLSREHLDYHKNMDSYKQVKFSLFTNHVLNGGKAIINSNIVLPNRVIKKIKKKFISFVSFGKKNSDIYISKKRKNYEIKLFKEKYTILMNTKTSYEIRNIECAIAILLTIGIKKNKIINTINKLNNPPGRMESCLAMKNGSRVYVDFAHTPDALKNILISVKKSNGRKPNLIFGCGGNRDKSKRFKMGKIASLLANKIYVTDDNPRNETPSAIRKSIMRGCINAEDIGDRRQAIFKGIKDLRNKEILIIAGKGHEKFQIYNEKNLPFDDVKEANSIIRKINAKS